MRSRRSKAETLAGSTTAPMYPASTLTQGWQWLPISTAGDRRVETEALCCVACLSPTLKLPKTDVSSDSLPAFYCLCPSVPSLGPLDPLQELLAQRPSAPPLPFGIPGLAQHPKE